MESGVGIARVKSARDRPSARRPVWSQPVDLVSASVIRVQVLLPGVRPARPRTRTGFSSATSSATTWSREMTTTPSPWPMPSAWCLSWLRVVLVMRLLVLGRPSTWWCNVRKEGQPVFDTAQRLNKVWMWTNTEQSVLNLAFKVYPSFESQHVDKKWIRW